MIFSASFFILIRIWIEEENKKWIPIRITFNRNRQTEF